MRNLLTQLLAIGPELASFILTSPLVFARPTYALTPTEAPSPNLDISQLGRVALVGDFDSISLYQYEGQTENVLNTNGSQSLLTRYPNGAFESLGLSDAYIEAMCTFRRGGTVHGVVLGGNFTSVAGVQAQSVALWDPDTGGITPLPGINGKVSSLYCDDDSGTVYVGGMFTAGNSTNAMAWTTEWTNLPFSGFNGPVYSIEKNAAGNIVFGGEFSGLGMAGNGSSSSASNSSASINSDAQVINLAGGDIGATGTTTTAGFDDPTNIICKTGEEDGPGNTWLLADNTGGWWQGQFSFGFIPTKLRLYNTKYQGRGTKTFYFENLNSGGILNLNYIDVDGQNRSCSLNCPLPRGNSTYQDFYMVPAVGMDSFRIFITEWYGDGGGLAGIEMFQDELYSFAINDFNEPQCDGVSNGSSSTVSPSNGTWTRIPNNGQTSSDYLSATLTTKAQVAESPSVVFRPNIAQSGNYSILVYTPGCLQDNSCNTRGDVNMTGTMTSDQPPVSTTISQTNYYDKFDQIYYGYVDVDSGSFTPSVTLSPIADQPLPQTIVAQRVRFDIVTSTGGLNGLFEYNPDKATVAMDFSDSTIDTAGADLDNGALINCVVSYKNQIWAAGTFTGDGIQNIMKIGGKATSPPGSGLNSDVEAVYLDGSLMYLGGNFTNTVDDSEEGLNNVGAFDLDANEWVTLGAGVDGVVWDIVPLALNITAGNQQDCITINGNFSSVNSYGDNDAFDADGFAVWVPSKNAWLNNIPNADASISGRLMAMTPVPGLQWPLYAGQITSQAMDISGAAEMIGSGDLELQSFGITIQPSSSSSSSMRKRAVTSQDHDGVYTGFFYDDNNMNVTIFGGHFDATASDGSTLHNLIFVDNSGSSQDIAGAEELDNDSTVMAMDAYNNFIFAGGSLTGTVGDNDINGLIVYDLDQLEIASPHPPALGGDNVVVNAVATQPDSSNIYVGGSFEEAGSLPCATLCYYDASAQQWNTPGLGLEGTITAMFWSSKTELILAGDLTVGGKQTTMATYNSKQSQQTFTAYSGAGSLPGPISVLTPATSGYNEFWASGLSSDDNSPFLSHYMDGSWSRINGLGDGSDIRGIQVMTLTSDHDSTNDIPKDEVLMLVGNINIPNYGNASAALFNGTDFEPFALTNKEDGTQGTIAHIFVSNPSALMKMGGGNLAVGFVVLIGLAIALGLIFFIVVAGILVERARRRREGYVPMASHRNGNLNRIPPETLLGGLHGDKSSPPKV
ncbi:uncharacterized protein LTR77_003979 [Saxophila tyrrhenica]|uniref:Uncharacterized protein n=1 Tax=Saxophila tyrrhenica TaxID=1690608 RepID=A0AAV9PFE5_9PEZI|nr:hypothetical protein LTR77_003979 [Saxophila tyrrhenica]